MTFKNSLLFLADLTYIINEILKSEVNSMAKYEVKLSEEDLQIIKDCHSKNPSIMKAMNDAKKVED